MKRIGRPFLSYVPSAIAIACAIAALGQASLAQTGTTTAPPAHKPGLLSRIKGKFTGKKPGATATAATSTPVAAGQIVGNKNTKVYHVGDKGNMPADKNRVYFKTEAEAQAAGYHRAGAKAGTGMTASGKKLPARDPKTGRFIKK